MIKCPANYFGKGVDYILPDDPETIREFEKNWDEWLKEHPEDPTGEIALKALVPERERESDYPHPKYENRNEKGIFITKKDGHYTPHAPKPQHVRIFNSNLSEADLNSDEMSEIKLRLPKPEMELLKNYATFKRRRPRDIVSKFIRLYCKLSNDE